MILTASDVASLARSLSRWEWAEYIFCGLVTVGCLGEYVAEFTDWLTKGKEERKEPLVKGFTILLILALSAELVCLVKTNTLSGMLIGSLAEQAEKAAGDAALAIDRSKQAVTLSEEAKQTTKSLADKVASIGKEADAVTRRLETASRQLGTLEQRVRAQSPRWRLLEGRKATFIGALKPFAGQRVTVVRCGLMSAPEPYNLEQDLLEFLGKQGAGWAVESPGYTQWDRCTNGATSVGGNLIIFNSNASEGVKGSAKALGEVLNKLAITTITTLAMPEGQQLTLESFGAGSPWELAAKDPTAVFLLIGINPMFDLVGTNKHRTNKSN
jgi:hypothetical protein